MLTFEKFVSCLRDTLGNDETLFETLKAVQIENLSNNLVALDPEYTRIAKRLLPLFKKHFYSKEGLNFKNLYTFLLIIDLIPYPITPRELQQSFKLALTSTQGAMIISYKESWQLVQQIMKEKQIPSSEVAVRIDKSRGYGLIRGPPLVSRSMLFPQPIEMTNQPAMN